MAEETQYTAKTYIVKLTAAVAIGSGSTATSVFTAGANGTLIKTVHIKAQAANANRNMVRLYIDNANGTVTLLTEVDMLPVTQASINPSFEATVDLNFVLKSGYKLRASMDQAFTSGLNIIAEVLDIAYNTGAVREDTTQFTTNTGIVSDALANTSLTGSGTADTLPTVYTAGSSGTYKGSSIETITIKANVTNTPGMVRVFVFDTSTSYLLTEVPIPSIVPDTTDIAFEYTIDFGNNFDLQAGYSIKVATQVAQNFNIMVEGKDWNYAS